MKKLRKVIRICLLCFLIGVVLSIIANILSYKFPDQYWAFMFVVIAELATSAILVAVIIMAVILYLWKKYASKKAKESEKNAGIKGEKIKPAGTEQNAAIDSILSQPIGRYISSPSGSQGNTTESILSEQKQHFESLAAGKSPEERVSEKKLLEIFVTYFSPNTDFYSVPGSQKYIAYFNAVNAARDEMLKQPQLFTAATKWNVNELADLINNPQPGITNMMICSLIFLMGNYAVIKDAVYCVDFSEKIPNCVALYLLLIAQKQHAEKRKQLIDAGEGTDTEPLRKALESLKVCDSHWEYMIG